MKAICSFRLQFSVAEIPKWAEQYQLDVLEPKIVRNLVPKVRARGWLERDEFLTVCRWKTRRTQPRCRRNKREFIREVTRTALATPNERLRIEVLTLLNGVNWPTASVFLHWFHPTGYPILDFRALESLGVDAPAQYEFEFWWAYTCYCRKLADKAGVSLRMLDRALWQYSRDSGRKARR